MEFDPCLCLCPQNVLDVISLISRLNFTNTASFNLVLFTNVDDVKVIKEQVIEGGEDARRQVIILLHIYDVLNLHDHHSR